MTPEIRHLLGGYATGTLTDDERERLFAAALDDQALFDALAEEQPLKDLLDDPESRGYLLAELDQPAQTDTPMVGARMSKMARSAPAPTSVSMQAPRHPQPPKATARFWLPFAAVMMAMLVTGWFWWKSAPAPNLQVAVNTPSAPVSPTQPAKDKQATDREPPPAPKPSSPRRPPADVQAPKPAEVRQESARADTVQPLKKELDAVADKAQVNQVVAEANTAPAPATGNLASTAASPTPPAYRLLRLQNGQYVPTSAAARFHAGDTIVILLPVQSPEPQLAQANGSSIALEREGDWFRSAKIELQSGSPEFVITPDNPAAVRLQFAAGPQAQEAKAKAAPPLRIRLTVD